MFLNKDIISFFNENASIYEEKMLFFLCYEYSSI